MFLSVFLICNILLCTTSTFKLVNERSTNEEDHSDSQALKLSKLQSEDYAPRYLVPDIEEFNISSPFINEQLRNQMDILKQELEEIAKKLNHVPNSCNSNLYNGLLVSICIGLFSIITLV
uniref:SJCHGC05998 protein n=1 Tax=Schistosoma japonicum TaxID=6182 RepID=Q5D9D6_SCHJA|nr:SJCHGC05998 protein [Schistosoma japonicum]